VVLGRLGGLTPIHERVLYPAHRPPFTGRGAHIAIFPGPRSRATRLGGWIVHPPFFVLPSLRGEAHNICVLIQAMHALNTHPIFCDVQMSAGRERVREPGP
jgi:hypothetical protein